MNEFHVHAHALTLANVQKSGNIYRFCYCLHCYPLHCHIVLRRYMYAYVQCIMPIP